LLLRAVGLSLILLSGFHAVLWRSLNWSRDIERLAPLNARVFAAHTFFVVFVLSALGLLSLAKPDLLLEPSELARLLLVAIVAFWVARLAMQPLLFDAVMRSGWLGSPLIRISANLFWLTYVVVYGMALARQWAATRS
jgi:hypothetical protein